MSRREPVEKLKFTACEAEKSAAHRTTDVTLALTASGEFIRPEALFVVVAVAEAERSACPTLACPRAELIPTETGAGPLTRALRKPVEVIVAVSDWVVLLGMFLRPIEDIVAVIAWLACRPILVNELVVPVAVTARLGSTRACLSPIAVGVAVMVREASAN